MKRFRRSTATAIIMAMLLVLVAPIARPVAAAPLLDPLGALPGWFLDGGDPLDVVARLLPPDPLQGVLPAFPGTKTTVEPDRQAAGALTAPKAPGSVQIPAPPTPVLCPCGPANVSVATGNLNLQVTDAVLTGLGPDIPVRRRYSSASADTEGPLGFGWTLDLGSRLQMYVDYHITEHRADGTQTTFRFTDGSGGGFVRSFDGDSLIHTDLSRGSYTDDSGSGSQLVRDSAERYVVTRGDGATLVYAGYYAPWRSGQDAGAGRLQQWTDRNGHTLTFTYDDQGRLTRVAAADGRFVALTWNDTRVEAATDHAGRTFTYGYQNGLLTQVSSPDFPTITYTYDPSSKRLTGIAGGPEGAVAYGYDSEGRVLQAGASTYRYAAGKTTYTDAAGGEWIYEYNDKKQITTRIDPLLRSTVTVYDDRGRRSTVTEAGQVTTYTYDDHDRVLQEAGPNGTTAYTYGAFGLVTSVTSVAGTRSMTYDDRGNLLTVAETGKPAAAFTYDSAGRVLTDTVEGRGTYSYAYLDPKALHRPSVITDPLGGEEYRSHNALGQVTAVTDSRGFVTKLSYDDAGRLTGVVNPDMGESAYLYDAAGRLLKATEPGGAAVTHTYDPQTGRPLTSSVADGVQFTWAFDGMGRVLSATDEAGNKAEWNWDGAGQLRWKTNLRGAKTSYSYDDAGRVVTVASPAGTITYLRDPVTGRITGMTGPGSRSVSFDYDEAGRIVAVHTGGQTVSATLNAAGRPLTVTVPGYGTTAYAYDNQGRVTTVTGPDGTTTTTEFDALGRIVRTVLPTGLETTYHYNGNQVVQSDSLERESVLELDWRGRPVLVKNAKDVVVKLTYDKAGRLIQEESGDKVVRTYAYDSQGRVRLATDRTGKETAYSYDGYGRLLSVLDRLGRETTFAYDMAANEVTVKAPDTDAAIYRFDDADRRSEMIDPAGVRTLWSYTAEGQVHTMSRTGVTERTGEALEAVWTWQYDEAGKLTSVEDPLKRATGYGYDTYGRLVQVTAPLGAVTAYTYDTIGRVITRRQPNGGTTEYTYTQGLLTGMEDPAGGTWAYEYDVAGRLTKQTDAAGAISVMAYDELDRVLTVSRPGNATETAVTTYAYDTEGRLTGVKDALGQERLFRYDEAGRLQAMVNPLDQTYQFAYDDEGNVLQTTDPMGRATSFSYDGSNRLKSRKTADGVTVTYVYDGGGRLRQATLGDGTTEYLYDGLGQLDSVKDPLGRLTTYGYDLAGNRTAVTDATGRTTFYRYDELNRLKEEEDRLGHITGYAYDVVKGITQVTDKGGHKWTYQYNQAGLLASVTDPQQRETRYEYDRAGRVVLVTDPLGSTRAMDYDVAGNLLAIRETEGAAAAAEAGRLTPAEPAVPDPLPIEWSYSYDVAGRLISQKDPAGLVTDYSYDALGRRTAATWPAPEAGKTASISWSYYADNQLKSVTNELGGVTQYEYDEAGRLKQVTDARGFPTGWTYTDLGLVASQTDAAGTTRFEYDLAGNLTASVDPRPGHPRTEYAYDALNRLVTVRAPEQNTQVLEYDAEGRLLKQQDGRGYWWSYDYDALGRRTSVIDPMNNGLTMAYSATGKLTSTIDALQRKTVFTYDALDRLIKKELPGGIVEERAYDWRSNLVTLKDPEGHLTRFAFTRSDLLSQVTDPLGGTTTYGYDVRGALTSVTDALDRETTFVRDASGRLLSERNPAGAEITYEYNQAGDRVKQVDPLGQVTTIAYNHRGQVTAIDYNGQEQALFAYDEVGNMTRAANGLTAQRYEYDGLNRLVAASNEVTGQRTGFAYDPAGNRTAITDPEGNVTRYTYDAAGRLTDVMPPDGNQSTMAWDAVNRLTRVKRPNGITTEYAYDPAGRVASLTHTGPAGLINSYSYTYDQNGNQTRQVEASGAETTFEYDALNRLTRVQYPKAQIEAIRADNLSVLKFIRPTREGEKGDTGTPPLMEDTAEFVSRAPWAGKGAGKENAGESQGNGGDNSQGNGGGSSQGNGGSSQGNGGGSSQGNGGGSSQGNGGGSSQGNGGGSSQGNGGDNSQGNGGGNQDRGNGTQGNNKEAEHGKGQQNAAQKCEPKVAPGQAKKEETQQDSGWKAYDLKPGYLLEPVNTVAYTYDAVGNRETETRDGQEIRYTYDAANRLLSRGDSTYTYDAAGNLSAKQDGEGLTSYSYNAAGKLTRVDLPDGAYVAYGYDALGRKALRTESAWVAPGQRGKALGKTEEKGLGNNSTNLPPGQSGDKAKAGNGNQVECPDELNSPSDKDSAKGASKEKGGSGEGKSQGEGRNKLKLVEDTTTYLYDGLSLNLLKEYKGQTASKAAYYYANGQVLARKMNGLKGAIVPEPEAGLANGGTYYYLTDGLGTVSSLTDHQGAVVSQYRYDAFGGLFTGMIGPYNTTGLTGKAYDARTGLMDYSARWLDPVAGRFTQPDPFGGTLSLPMSQHRYSYGYNNPIRNTDPTGMTVCIGEECNPDIDTFYSTEWFSYNVPWVTRVEPDEGGYWEYGWWADVRHWAIYLVWVDGHESLYNSGSGPIAYYEPYEHFVRTGPPPKSDDEIREEDRERLRQEAGDAPPSAVYAPGVLAEITKGLATDWEGYDKGHSGPLNISYTEGEAYPTHPLVSNAKAMLKDLVGFPYVQDDEYGSFTTAAVRDFQERMGLVNTPGIEPGVLDEATFYALKQAHDTWEAVKEAEAQSQNGKYAGGALGKTPSASKPAATLDPNKPQADLCQDVNGVTTCAPVPKQHFGGMGEGGTHMDDEDFGLRVNPVSKEVKTHNGVDFNKGVTKEDFPPVFAVRDGTVADTETKCENGDLECGDYLGNQVIIQHEDGTYTVYAHLSYVDVSLDDPVAAGQYLGNVGTTGWSTGNHLHMEYWVPNGQKETDELRDFTDTADPMPVFFPGMFPYAE